MLTEVLKALRILGPTHKPLQSHLWCISPTNPAPLSPLLSLKAQVFFKIFYFFFTFGCNGSSLLRAGFSLWWLLLLQSTGSRRKGFSSCSTRALERAGLSSCGAWAQ